MLLQSTSMPFFKKNPDYFLVTLHHSSSVSCCWIVSKMKPWPRDYPPLSFTRVLHCERSKIDNSYFLAPATMKGSGFCSRVSNHRDSGNCLLWEKTNIRIALYQIVHLSWRAASGCSCIRWRRSCSQWPPPDSWAQSRSLRCQLGNKQQINITNTTFPLLIDWSGLWISHLQLTMNSPLPLLLAGLALPFILVYPSLGHQYGI